MCLHAPDEVFVSSADSVGLSLDLLCPLGIRSLLSLINIPAVCMCLHAPDEVFVSSADSAGLSLDLLCPLPVAPVRRVIGTLGSNIHNKVT